MNPNTTNPNTTNPNTTNPNTTNPNTTNPVVGLLSGPNLNLLGVRQPEIYGTATLEDHVTTATATAQKYGYAVEHFQSNHEGELVDVIQQNRRRWAALVVNPGALTHYGWSIHDALAAFEAPIVELHLSNPNAREPWRHISVVAPVATGSIIGFGGEGYRLAIEAAVAMVDAAPLADS